MYIERYCTQFESCEIYRLTAADGSRKYNLWNVGLIVLGGIFSTSIALIAAITPRPEDDDDDGEEQLTDEERAAQKREQQAAKIRARRAAHVTACLAAVAAVVTVCNSAIGPAKLRDDYRELPPKIYDLEVQARREISSFEASMQEPVDVKLAQKSLEEAEDKLRGCRFLAAELSWDTESISSAIQGTSSPSIPDAETNPTLDASADTAQDAAHQGDARGHHIDSGADTDAVRGPSDFASSRSILPRHINIETDTTYRNVELRPGTTIRVKHGAVLRFRNPVVIDGGITINGIGDPGKDGAPGQPSEKPWTSQGGRDFLSAKSDCIDNPAHPDRGNAGQPGGSGGKGATVIFPSNIDRSLLSIRIEGGPGGKGGAGGLGRLLRNGQNFTCDGCHFNCPAGPAGQSGPKGPSGEVRFSDE